MPEPTLKKRIWGWYFFDWANQPFFTILMTFVFAPYFAGVAAAHFMETGLDETTAKAWAQTYWSWGLTIIGLVVAIAAPIMGAMADTSGRRLPWIAVFAVMFVAGSFLTWFTNPDGSNMAWSLAYFGLAFLGAEFALIFTNAQLPGLGSRDEIGKISGSGFSFGYVGGLIALILVLVLLVEQSNGKTIAGLVPIFGLDPDAREGTRAAGPFVAIWFLIFMIPYFLWVRERQQSTTRRSMGTALRRLGSQISDLRNRISLSAYLGGSMFYRDALNGLYGFGGTYAFLVLDWEVAQVGVFGIIGVLSAAVFTQFGGYADRRYGPKPVIIVSIAVLISVCAIIAGISRQSILGIPLAVGSLAPDVLFYLCGSLIGGFGGVLQSASRSMMVRHSDKGAETSSFGLYGLTGRATAFLAPALIGAASAASGNARFGVVPLIFLFLLGLFLLRWVKADGDRVEKWAESSSQPS